VCVHLGGPATHLGATTRLITGSIIQQRTLVAVQRMLILLALATEQKTTSFRVSGQWLIKRIIIDWVRTRQYKQHIKIQVETTN